MMVRKRWKLALTLAALASALTACTTGFGGGSAETGNPAPVASEQPAEQPTEQPAADPATSGPAEESPAEDAPAGQPASFDELPKTAELEILLEGMPENVPATLTKSDQGYAFYLMEGFDFAMEEPGKDLIFHKEFPEYSTRVELLPADANVEEIKANAEEQLKAVGDVIEMKDVEIHPSIRDRAAFFLHASHAEGTRIAALVEGEGGLFLCTMNFPLGEAAEGVTPRFIPMLNSLVVVAE